MAKIQLPEEEINGIITRALAEDLCPDDITSAILIPPNLEGKATVLIKEAGIIAGIDIAGKVFLKIDPSLQFNALVADGTGVKPGDMIAAICGKVISILKAERVALNFLQRLSGIASQTAKYVAEISDLKVAIADLKEDLKKKGKG